MEIRLAAPIQYDSIVDGEGMRAVLWTQGCPHNCEGCHNPNTHDLNGGEEYDLEEIFKEIDDLKYHQGITLSGGDPFFQPVAATEIAEHAHKNGLNVWAYTGFTYDAIVNGNDIYRKELLKNVDVLVDGRFEIKNKSLACKFRGSTNQRIIDVKKSLETGKVVLYYKD